MNNPPNGNLNYQLQKLNTVDRKKMVNNIKPLFINEFSGFHAAMHPSVLYFPDYFTGYRYWMVCSPLPSAGLPYIDRWECPCLFKSADGVHWKVGSTSTSNPIIDLTAPQIANGDYFSDPCLVMNGATMEIWYRLTNGAATAETDIYRITTTDGTTYSAPQKVLDSLSADNGIGGVTASMRSQQVFYADGVYRAYYTNMKTDKKEYAETTDPASGIWTNKTLLVGDTSRFSPLWHIGIYNDGGTYHLTGLNADDNSIEYYTSPDGINFTYLFNIIDPKSVDTQRQVTLNYMYQTVPLKVDDQWMLFCSGTYRSDVGSNKWGIFAYKGATLETLEPIDASVNVTRQVFPFASPLAYNPFVANGESVVNYRLYENDVQDKQVGIGLKFGALVTDIHIPRWISGTGKFNIPFVYEAATDAPSTMIPVAKGQLFINTATNRIWIAKATASASLDWYELRLFAPRKDLTTGATIDVTGVSRGVINAGIAATLVTNLTGIYDGQELFLLNTLGGAVTLDHAAGGSGQMKFRGGADKVLAQYEGVSLIAVSTVWYEK